MPGSDLRYGSIPACAGEPGKRRSSLRSIRVYPRVCGGTIGRLASGEFSPGLSPRVRGNHKPGGLHDERTGSIPACAGEPKCFSGERGLSRVYPRVCGGTNTTRTES